MDKLKREIPQYMTMPYSITHLPVMLDYGPRGYADGKDKRRTRREQERKNKKQNGR